jgi:hypothetical protein
MTVSPTLRSTFLGASHEAVKLIAAPEVADAWQKPSVLPDFDVASLVGHLARVIMQVEWYLDAEAPTGSPISAIEYYVPLTDGQNLTSPRNLAIRETGTQAAAGGHDELLYALRESIGQLQIRLQTESEDRVISVPGSFAQHGRVLTLNEYLKTRILELVVHLDDLADSVGTSLPSLSDASYDIAITLLVAVAVTRNSHIAVIRALARRERDVPQALRVL